MTAAIQVEQLSKTYRHGWFGRQRLDALREVTFDVRPGEAFGLLGPNGAGKTTFIKVLLGIVRRSGGEATVMGQAAGSQAARRRIGYLPEHLRIPARHTALSALDFYGRLSGLASSDIRAKQDEILSLVGLKGREQDAAGNYSKGMLQRLGLAQALLHDPDLLILDEPTDGLDPLGRSQVRSILAELKSRGKTIFLNSHILQEVELICDRVAILDHGELRCVGPVAEITADVQTGLEVEFELAGAAEEAAAVFDIEAGDMLTTAENGVLNAVARRQSQEEVDALVDALRARRISVIRLARRRITLEDAFLKLLDKSSSEAQVVEGEPA